MPHRIPHPFAPPQPGGSTLEELVDRHAHLVAVGLANCRAAQALKKEITRRQLERHNSELETRNPKPETQGPPLANDDDHYNPDEHRDKDGKWTTGPNATGGKTNNPPPTNEFAPEVARPSAPNGLTQTNPLAPDRMARANPDQSLMTLVSDKVAPDPLAQVKLNPLEKAEVEGGPGMAREDYGPEVPPELNPNLDFARYLVRNPLAPITEAMDAAGTAGKAVVGDIAAKWAGYPDAGGNISAFMHGEELPLDRALRDSALEQNFRGEVPIATVMGRVSEGIASTLPILPFIEAMPLKLQQAAATTFTLRMAAETPEIARQLGEEYGKPPEQRDPDKIDKLVADAIQIIGYTALGGVEVEQGTERPEPEPNSPVQWPEIQTPSYLEPGTSSAEGAVQRIQPESTGPSPRDLSKPAAPVDSSPKTEQSSETQKPEDPASETPNEQKSEPESLTGKEKTTQPAGKKLRKSNNYRKTFFAAHPELRGKVVVHHVIEQKVLKWYKGIITESEMHSLANLRGIPKDINTEVHLRQIYHEWKAFYREHPKSVTKEQLLAKAREIDQKFGRFFIPPITGANQ